MNEIEFHAKKWIGLIVITTNLHFEIVIWTYSKNISGNILLRF